MYKQAVASCEQAIVTVVHPTVPRHAWLSEAATTGNQALWMRAVKEPLEERKLCRGDKKGDKQTAM